MWKRTFCKKMNVFYSRQHSGLDFQTAMASHNGERKKYSG